MKSYADEVKRLRSMPTHELQRVRIKGKHAKEKGYTFAIGTVGNVIRETETTATVFTGNRIWKIEKEDIEVMKESQHKK